MLEQVLTYLNNWFPSEVRRGAFKVEGGSLDLPWLAEGQWFRVVGSVFNDGLHRHPATDLTDEEFEGAVWALAIPKAVIELADRIADWQAENGKAAEGPYQSESFGGYSYTLKNDDAASGGSLGGWRAVFASELRRWKRL